MDSQFQRWKDWIEGLNTDGIGPQKPLPEEKFDDTEVQVETMFYQNGFVPKPGYVSVISEAIRRAGSSYYRLPDDVNAVINALMLGFLRNLVGTRKIAVLRSVFFFGVGIGNLLHWTEREKK